MTERRGRRFQLRFGWQVRATVEEERSAAASDDDLRLTAETVASVDRDPDPLGQVKEAYREAREG